MEMNDLKNLTDPRGISFNLGLPDKDKDVVGMDEESKAYKKMSRHWELPLALRGGTLRVRNEGRKWLPQEPRETNTAYINRLNRSVVFGAYTRTIDTLAGLPFLRAINIENIPDKLSYLKDEADSNNRDLTNFAHSLLEESLDLGLTYILVDMPYFEGNLSLEEEIKYKIRPYFSQISPVNVIRWTKQRVGGLDILTSVTIKEEETEYNGHKEEEIKQIRVITSSEIQIWREKEEKWYLHKVIPNNLGKIPIIAVYTNRTGFMQGQPCLEDLAWLNLRHYQKQSDLDNIEHVANVPILFGAGFQEGELDGVEIGPNRAITASDPNAKLGYVEHSAAAIGASQASIRILEERMASMGADLIVRKSVDRQTATARRIDQSESISMLQVIINNIETALEQAIKLAGEWIDVTADSVQIDIGDYLDTPSGPNLLDLFAQSLIENGGMSLEDIQHELRRRGVLSDVFENGAKQPIKQNQPEV
jgi:hypothetical protein